MPYRLVRNAAYERYAAPDHRPTPYAPRYDVEEYAPDDPAPVHSHATGLTAPAAKALIERLQDAVIHSPPLAPLAG